MLLVIFSGEQHSKSLTDWKCARWRRPGMLRHRQEKEMIGVPGLHYEGSIPGSSPQSRRSPKGERGTFRSSHPLDCKAFRATAQEAT
jgi:hypothetical protein